MLKSTSMLYSETNENTEESSSLIIITDFQTGDVEILL